MLYREYRFSFLTLVLRAQQRKRSIFQIIPQPLVFECHVTAVRPIGVQRERNHTLGFCFQYEIVQLNVCMKRWENRMKWCLCICEYMFCSALPLF